MTANKDWLKRRVKIIVVGIAHKADYTLFVQDLSILYEIFWGEIADLCKITKETGAISAPAVLKFQIVPGRRRGYAGGHRQGA